MQMKSGQRWHCVNPACCCEVLVESDSEIPGTCPRCVCGGAMKRNYAPPVFQYLDFLRVEDPIVLQQKFGDE